MTKRDIAHQFKCKNKHSSLRYKDIIIVEYQNKRIVKKANQEGRKR